NVWKGLGFLDGSSTPTEHYKAFRDKSIAKAILARYSPLLGNSRISAVSGSAVEAAAFAALKARSQCQTPQRDRVLFSALRTCFCHLPPLYAAPVAPQIDMQSRAEAKSFALTNLDQPLAAFSQHIRIGTFSHQNHAAPVRADLAKHRCHLRQIFRTRNHEFEL